MINLSIHDSTIKNIELIIFDKDGTLFELYPYWNIVAKQRGMNICSAMNIQEETLVEFIAELMGVNNKTKSMNPKGPIGIYDRIYIQDLLLKELKMRGYPINMQIIVDGFRKTDIFISQDEVLKQALIPVEGLRNFLDSLRSKSKCAIFSYDQTLNLKHITDLMKMNEYFSILLGGDMIKYPKPDPWGCRKIMQDLKISPKHTILIGDSIHDIESGKKAECQYVITRKSDISDLDLLEPMSDFIINDYNEILAID